MKTLTGQECAAMARRAVALAKKKQTTPQAAERLSHLASELTITEVLVSRPDMLVSHYTLNGNAKEMAELKAALEQPGAGSGRIMATNGRGSLKERVQDGRRKTTRIQYKKKSKGGAVAAVQEAFRILGKRDAKVSELVKVLKSYGIARGVVSNTLSRHEDKFTALEDRGWWRVNHIRLKENDKH